MNDLRESDLVLIESLGHELARAPSVELIALQVQRTLRKIVRVPEIRLVAAEQSAGWREWTAGDRVTGVRTCTEFPTPSSRGTAISFDPAAPEEGFVWMPGSSSRASQALRLIAPHVGTAVVLHTAVGRARRVALQERELAQERFRSRDEERRRISQELHDDLGQSLALLKVNLKWVEDGIRGKGGMEEAVAELALARETTGSILAKVRDLSRTLYPAILDTLGLTAALKELVHQATRRTDIEGSCNATGQEKALRKDVAEGLYRCCQEAINNAVRHAGASRIAVDISYSPSEVRLTVEDNGKGFEPGRLHDTNGHMMSSGFWTIRQRVAGLGGAFRVSTALGTGVTIEITIPTNVRIFDAGNKDKAADR